MQCCVARVGRVQDPEMRGGEDRIVLPLADKVDCLSASETSTGGEIMRVAVAILGGNAGKDASTETAAEGSGKSGSAGSETAKKRETGRSSAKADTADADSKDSATAGRSGSGA